LPLQNLRGAGRGVDDGRDRTHIASAAGTTPPFWHPLLTPTEPKAKFPVRLRTAFMAPEAYACLRSLKTE